MKTSFKAYSDSQHGWIAVKRRLLLELGILYKITQFSYQRGKTVYLEEDCDADTFIEAFVKAYNTQPILTHNYVDGNSPIRSYEGFRLTPHEAQAKYNDYC